MKGKNYVMVVYLPLNDKPLGVEISPWTQNTEPPVIYT